MTARKSASALLVPTTPTDPNHAASKSYVDSSISSATSGVNVAMDHVTGLVAALGGKMDKSVIDAKGEIVAGTAANTPGIVTAPSSDGQFLKSATAQATGMGWAALTSSDVGLGNVNNTSDAVKSVASAATLTTPRNIAGVSFDGSAAISLNQDNIGDATTNRSYTAVEKTKLAAITGTNTGDQTTITGNAGTATKLATARAINGVNFDGSAAITINAIDATAREPAITIGTSAQYWRGDKTMQTLNSAAVGLGNVDNTSDATKNAAAVALTNKDLTGLSNTFPTFNQNTTGTAAGITGKTTPTGAIVGTTDAQALTNKDLTGAGNTFPTLNQSTTGNSATATKLATARNINGIAFDGTADIVTGEAVSTSAAASLTLTTAFSTYVFTGSSPTTWTLPAISGNTGKRLIVENRGSAAITLQRAGADQIWFLAALTNVTIAAGGSMILVNDGTYWNSLSTDLANNSVGLLPVANGGTNASSAAAARTSLGLVIGTNVQAWDPDLDSWAGKSTPTGIVVGTTDTQTLSGKTFSGYTESVQALGTIGASKTIPALTNGTVVTGILTASTASTITMPTMAAGTSFAMILRQAAATGNGTATFTGVKWPGGTAPVITATAGACDLLSFFSDGTDIFGSFIQGYTY